MKVKGSLVGKYVKVVQRDYNGTSFPKVAVGVVQIQNDSGFFVLKHDKKLAWFTFDDDYELSFIEKSDVVEWMVRKLTQARIWWLHREVEKKLKDCKDLHQLLSIADILKILPENSVPVEKIDSHIATQAKKQFAEMRKAYGKDLV